jgi:hypothetical protein
VLFAIIPTGGSTDGFPVEAIPHIYGDSASGLQGKFFQSADRHFLSLLQVLCIIGKTLQGAAIMNMESDFPAANFQVEPPALFRDIQFEDWKAFENWRVSPSDGVGMSGNQLFPGPDHLSGAKREAFENLPTGQRNLLGDELAQYERDMDEYGTQTGIGETFPEPGPLSRDFDRQAENLMLRSHDLVRHELTPTERRDLELEAEQYQEALNERMKQTGSDIPYPELGPMTQEYNRRVGQKISDLAKRSPVDLSPVIRDAEQHHGGNFIEITPISRLY